MPSSFEFSVVLSIGSIIAALHDYNVLAIVMAITSGCIFAWRLLDD